jgi:anti-sigma-K factor RskA
MTRTTSFGDHEAYDALAVGWALHSLEPEDEAAFAGHLSECSRCAATVAETQDVMAAMAVGLPAAEPSEGLRSRLRAAVERTEQEPRRRAPDRRSAGDDVAAAESSPSRRAAVPRPRPGPPVRRRVLAVGLVAASIATIIGLGVWNVVLTSTREEAVRAAAEQSAVLEEVLQPGVQVMARMTDEDGVPMATLVARDGRMRVVTQGLSVNDDTAETYVLWGLEGGTPVVLGAFDVERSRTDVQTVGSGPAGVGPFEAYAVSLEPGREPPATPSEVVAIGQISS